MLPGDARLRGGGGLRFSVWRLVLDVCCLLFGACCLLFFVADLRVSISMYPPSRLGPADASGRKNNGPRVRPTGQIACTCREAQLGRSFWEKRNRFVVVLPVVYDFASNRYPFLHRLRALQIRFSGFGFEVNLGRTPSRPPGKSARDFRMICPVTRRSLFCLVSSRAKTQEPHPKSHTLDPRPHNLDPRP